MRNIESIGNFMSIFYTLNRCFIQGFTAGALRRVGGLSVPGVTDGWGLPRQDDSAMHYVVLNLLPPVL